MAKTKTKGTAKTVGDTPVPQPITINSTNPKIMADNIKKLEKAIKGADDASEISYNNMSSHLTASNVQAAIDEVVSGLTSPDAEDVSYDNTNSGLEATNTQAAIDEIAYKIDGMTTWESITVPEPTVSEDTKTRTYSIDLSDYKLLRITVGLTSVGGIFETDILFVGDTVRKYYQVSGSVESYAIVSTTSSLLIYTETLSTNNVDIKSILGVK